MTFTSSLVPSTTFGNAADRAPGGAGGASPATIGPVELVDGEESGVAGSELPPRTAGITRHTSRSPRTPPTTSSHVRRTGASCSAPPFEPGREPAGLVLVAVRRGAGRFARSDARAMTPSLSARAWAVLSADLPARARPGS